LRPAAAQGLQEIVGWQPAGADRRADQLATQPGQALALHSFLQPQVALPVGAVLGRAANELHGGRAGAQGRARQVGVGHADAGQRDHLDVSAAD